MPIIHTLTVRYRFARLTVDVSAVGGPAGEVTFTRIEDELPAGEVTFRAGADDIVPLLAAQATSGKSRANDIADVCYELAIAKQWLSGEIEQPAEPSTPDELPPLPTEG